MSQPPSSKNHSVLWLVSALMVVAGLAILFLGTTNSPAASPFALPEAAPLPAENDQLALPLLEPTAALSGDDNAAPLDPTTMPAPDGSATAIPASDSDTDGLTIALPEPMPPELLDGVLRWATQHPGTRIVTGTQDADVWISTEAGGALLAERIYVPVSRYGDREDDVSAADLLGDWMASPESGKLAMVADTNAAAGMTLLWGAPQQLEVLPDGHVMAATLENSRGRHGVLPFDQLVPATKALSIGGLDPTDNQFDATDYPLALRLYIDSTPEAAPQMASLLGFIDQEGLATNRDPSKLTVLMMTGVTAMARMTALRMEQKGYDYPAAEIGPILSAADITHISNEIPFTPDCQVNAGEDNLTLCSSPEYLEALRDVGVDIVGLTGNHLNDFGKDDSLWSIQFYKEQNLATYGGGANLEEALKPLVVQHNGNRLVFLGANSFGPPVAWAEPDWPGSAPYDEAQMAQEIADARSKLGADVVLAEMQWEESYDTLPIQSQVAGFRALSAAGADIVTGVQSHVPQAVEFTDNGIILYGLGNLFFDQMWSDTTRQGLIPRHTIYDGRYISTKLQTTVLEDFAQPRWASEGEREVILNRVYTASGW